MAKKETLGDRMKHFESCFDYKFIRSLPMIVRLDGRAFHSWTRKTHCTKPFDHQMMQTDKSRHRLVIGPVSPFPIMVGLYKVITWENLKHILLFLFIKMRSF